MRKATLTPNWKVDLAKLIGATLWLVITVLTLHQLSLRGH